MSKLRKLRVMVDRGLGGILVVLMAAMVLNVLWQVFTRFVLRDPSSYTEEIARYLLVWVGLLGASYAAGKRLHLAIDLLPTRLEGSAKRVLALFIESCAFLFALFVLVVGGSRLVRLTLILGQHSAALQVPLGYVYLALPLAGLLIMFYSALSAVEEIRKLQGQPGEAAAESPERGAE